MTDESNGQGPHSFPWQKWIGGFPAPGPQGGLPGAGIHDYVQDLLKQAMVQSGSLAKPAAASVPQPQVFETHRSVIVRVKVPAGAERGRIRVVHDTQQLRIEGLYDERTLRVRLPALVHTGRSRSQIKDGILEVRLLKRRKPGPEREVYVEY